MRSQDLSILEERLTKKLQETIVLTVNGKIDKIDAKLDTHNEQHAEDMKEVRAHMEKAAPVIEAYSTVGNLGAFIKWFGGVVTAAGVVWLLAAKYLHL